MWDKVWLAMEEEEANSSNDVSYWAYNIFLGKHSNIAGKLIPAKTLAGALLTLKDIVPDLCSKNTKIEKEVILEELEGKFKRYEIN